MNKKIKIALLCALALTLVLCVTFAACKPKATEQDKDGKTGMLFKTNGYADTVYAISQGLMSAKEYTMISSLQGIVAQNRAAIFITGDDGASVADLETLANKHNFKVVEVMDAWQLVEMFSDSLNGKKYVLYNDLSDNGTSVSDQTINYATVVAGVEKYLMVAKSIEQMAQSAGLTLGRDVTQSGVNTRSIFEEYKDKLNPDYLIHQAPNDRQLRDYAIAGKAMCFYADKYDGSDADTRTDILSWAKDNAPILGWTENEINFVAANSLLSKVTFAADYCTNLSFTSAFETNKITQSKYEQRTITPQQGKHYVAVVMSDGDNVQWMTRGFANAPKYFGADVRGSFPMTWTMSPAMYDLSPDTLSALYANASARDQFIAGPSGVGYVNMTEYNNDSLDEYCAYTAGYMEQTDTAYVNLLDNSVDPEALKHIASYKQVQGGVWSVGNKYIEGEGAVYWVNDKPFLTARETLWRIAGDDNSNKYWGFVERVAQRINGYKRDYTDIAGYTVVLAHAWSIGSMDYINRFMSELDEDVIPVTLGELLTLVKENVEHTDAFPNDIAYDHFKDNLAPVSSEQYVWSRIKDTPVTNERAFVFSSKNVVTRGGWKFGTGGLEYDKAGWVSSDSTGTPAIMLDGSDLEDVLDPMPNAWVYNAFQLTDKDKYLTVYVNGGGGADVNMRIRALYEENGNMKSQVLISDDYDTPLNDYGWYLRNGKSAPYFVYDISALSGKKIILSIEQDDSGDGSGEYVYVTELKITEEKPVKEQLYKWSANKIRYDWESTINVSAHSEGLCLEPAASESSITATLQVTEEHKVIKFYVRMFVRQDNPDVEPRLQGYVNGKLIAAAGQNADRDYISVDGDNYRCIVYDLSDYVGQEVTFKFASIPVQGGGGRNHAAIGKIVFADSYEIAELRRTYRDSDLVAL